MSKERKRLGYFLITLFLLLNLSLLIKTRIIKALFFGSIKFIDFDNYYQLVGLIFSGQDPYKGPYAATLGPPLVFLFLLPFRLFSLNQGRILMTFINLASAYFSCWLLAKRFLKKHQFLVSLFLNLLLLSSFLARFNILMGQPNLFLTLLITVLLVNEKPKIKGFSLGLASIVKTFLGFAFLALLKKNKKTLLWFVIFFFAGFLLSLIFIKPEVYFDFFKERFIRITFIAGKPSNLDYYNQSLKSTMFRLGISQWYGYVYPFVLLFSGVFLLISGNLEAGIVLSILVSPVCWQYYFVILFPVMIKMFKKVIFKPKLLVLWFVSFFFWWIQRPFLHSGEMNLRNGFFASHYFFSAVILLLIVILEKRSRVKLGFKKRLKIIIHYFL